MHITDGNEHEERLVKIMGGIVIETESEKLISQGMLQGQAKMIIEIGQEDGLDEVTILRRLQDKIGMSMEEADDCMKKYGKQPV